MFSVEDQWHCEPKGEYQTFEDALNAIRQWADVPWNQSPNVAPCTSWRSCGRRYVIGGYDNTTKSWITTPIVEIDAKGVRWEPGWAPEPE